MIREARGRDRGFPAGAGRQPAGGDELEQRGHEVSTCTGNEGNGEGFTVTPTVWEQRGGCGKVIVVKEITTITAIIGKMHTVPAPCLGTALGTSPVLAHLILMTHLWKGAAVVPCNRRGS